MNKNILKRLFSVFDTFDISYVLIGGYAAAVWGSIRATKGVDFLVDIPPDKIQSVTERFKDRGFLVEYRTGEIGDPVRGVIKLKYRIGEDEESIELLLGIDKMPANIYSRSEKIEMMGIEIPVVSPEDLIVLKLLAGGPIDLQDARNIYKIMREKLEIKYLEKELERCKFSLEPLDKLAQFDQLVENAKKRNIKTGKNIDIDKLMNGMNNGLFTGKC